MKSKKCDIVFYTLIVGCSGLFLPQCTVGPDYKTPQMHTPNQYATTAPATPATQSAATEPVTTQPAPTELTRWWETFHDPMLNALITQATQANLDVKLATARIRQARAELGYAQGALLPGLDAKGSYSRTRNSHNNGSVPGTFNNFQAGFDAGWEVDVFGGTRRNIEAADATLQGKYESRRDVLITLLGEVAQSYIALRGAQYERSVVENNIRTQADSLEMQRRRMQAGTANDLPVAQVEAQLESTRSRLPSLEITIQTSIHRLAVLLNRDSAELLSELTPQTPLPVGPSEVPTGLPSELLRRRPDIRQAERALAAATANIGVATADLYPRFNLVGSVGMSSAKLRHMADADSLVWNFGPSVSWNIFNGGQTRANIEIRNAQQEQALIQYQQSILLAVADVEDALEAHQKNQMRRTSLIRATQANRRALELAQRQNAAGVIDFLNVLNAQQSLYNSENDLAQCEESISTNLVALYKALGGGWETFEQSPENPKK